MGIMEKKMETTTMGYIGFRVYSPPEIERIWLWVYYNEITTYPMFYLFKEDYRV